MTALQIIKIRCDSCGALSGAHETTALARAVMRREGWSWDGEHDSCRPCTTRKNGTERDAEARLGLAVFARGSQREQVAFRAHLRRL